MNLESNLMQTLKLLERFEVSDECYHELLQVISILFLSAVLRIYIDSKCACTGIP